jgi:hypothetical protein
MTMDKTNIVSTMSGILTAVASVFGFLKTPKGRKIVASMLSGDLTLDVRIQAAIEAAVEALTAALDARGEELRRLGSELDSLTAEVARLKEADDWKTSRIKELEDEIIKLREENELLKTELSRRRGGRPKKVVD